MNHDTLRTARQRVVVEALEAMLLDRRRAAANRARAIELLHPVKPIMIEGERFRFIPIGRN